MATLYQIGDDGSRADLCAIDEEPVVVGRSGRARVNIEDDGLSRRHFLIQRDGGDYVIKDLSSRNGTWVDGERVFAEKLHHNAHILAGRTLFLFANQPVSSTAVRQPLTGPRGTVMISAAAEAERSAAEPILCQSE